MGKSGGGSSSGGTAPAGTTTSTQTSSPWSGQIPFLTGGPVMGGQGQPGNGVAGVMPSADYLYQNYTPQYFPSSTVAPLTDAQNAGINELTNFGVNGSSSVNSANNAITSMENGDYLSAGNPYFQGAVQSLTNSIAPAINSQFNAAGRSNSGLNEQAVASAVANAAAPMAMQNYQQGLSNMLQGAYVAPQLQQAQLQPANALLTAGGLQQQQAQNELNDQVNRFNYNQMLPYNQLNAYESAVTGNYGGTSTLTQPYFQNQLANALGGAAGGSALGKGLGGSLFGSTGSQVGGTAGGLAGLKLSDRRAKRNIDLLFYHHNGLPVYAFTYGDDGEIHVGFMADEVAEIHPEAIVEIGGLNHVDYFTAIQ